MTTEKLERNKEVVHQYAAAFDNGVLDTLRSMSSPEMFEKTQQMLSYVESHFSDHKVHIQELIAEGDTVVAKVLSSGRHTGEFRGVPATGRKWDGNEGVIIYRLKDGILVDVWTLFNVPMHMEKLGISMTLSA